jgi:hypothetical protein
VREKLREEKGNNQVNGNHMDILLKILDGRIVCLNFFIGSAICKISLSSRSLIAHFRKVHTGKGKIVKYRWNTGIGSRLLAVW